MNKKDMRIAVKYAFKVTKDFIVDLKILEQSLEKRLKPILGDKNIPSVEKEYFEVKKRIQELKRQNRVFGNYLNKN